MYHFLISETSFEGALDLAPI
ncbi:hypothetical protein L195_g064668, partial [Trifolium pratense]